MIIKMKDIKILLVSLLIIITIASILSYLEMDLRVLILLFLFFPLLDKQWVKTKYHNQNTLNINTLFSIILLLCSAVTLFFTNQFEIFFASLFIAAIPEEWYFRVYLMTKLGKSIKANVMTSVVFSLLHMITVGWMAGLLVFVPSLVYGWFFQKTSNIILVMTMHAISNIVYLIWLVRYF